MAHKIETWWPTSCEYAACEQNTLTREVLFTKRAAKLDVGLKRLNGGGLGSEQNNHFVHWCRVANYLAVFLACYLAKNGELFSNSSSVGLTSIKICYLIRHDLPFISPSHSKSWRTGSACCPPRWYGKLTMSITVSSDSKLGITSGCKSLSCESASPPVAQRRENGRTSAAVLCHVFKQSIPKLCAKI